MTDKEYRELLAELAGREAESREKSKAEADRHMKELLFWGRTNLTN